MERADWDRIEALCADAMELAPAERAVLLDQRCGTDVALRREVPSLLDQLDSEPGFLEQPAIEGRSLGDETETLKSGVVIGAYQLERLLGRGGMGEVYLASRDVDGIAQQVALKIIRRGMNTDEVLRRFRPERRILESLYHPNVAALIDAGVTVDARPYFVMEYVDGQALTEYCDTRCLSINERLQLFQRICSAVHHAHQQLVVHRDIQPRNILVAVGGMPKLLDFGIGKVLAEGDSFGAPLETRTEMRLLTPEYAAPEQVTGGNVTTATDVYSLGVVLYELLTGRLPSVADGSRARMERALTESVPIRPSVSLGTLDATPPQSATTSSAEAARVRDTNVDGLRRRLSGDLDTIVLMALRKEPSRRYASASALAEDIQRHLDNRPVNARPDTLRYRLRKFAQRNTGGVVGAAAVVLALVAITAVSVVQSRRVAAAAARTAQERDKAVEVRGFLMEMFGATGADQAVGDTVSVRALLERQRQQLDKAYAGRSAFKADMLDVLADGYDRLGLYADAEPLAQQALALRRELLPPDHPDVATSLNLLGWIQHERGQSVHAETLRLEAARIRRNVPENAANGLSRSLNDLGVVYNALRRYPEAERVLREALDARLALFGESHRTVGITASNLAATRYFRQQVDSAISLQALALGSLQASVGPDHQRTVVALSNLAAFKRAKGDLAAAEQDYRDLAARQTRLQGRQHPVAARVLNSLAAVLADRGAREQRADVFRESESLFREALAAFEQRPGPTHVQVGQALDRLVGVLLLQRRSREAIPLGVRALRILRATSADTSRVVTQAAQRLAAAHLAVGHSVSADVLARQFNLKR